MGRAIHLAATNNRVDIDVYRRCGPLHDKTVCCLLEQQDKKKDHDMFARENNLGESLPPFQTDKRSNKKIQNYTFQVGRMPVVCIKTDDRRGESPPR